MTKTETGDRPGSLHGVGLRAAVILAVCLGLAGWMQASGTPEPILRSVPLVVMAIGFWALGVLPEALTGLLFMLGAVTLAGHPPALVFSGFATSAFWLIFAGAILSASVTQTGLSRWLIARFVARRFVVVGYAARAAMVVACGAALGFILPATMARVAVLVPLVMALCEAVGHRAGGRGFTGLVLAGAVGTFVVPISILPANLPNVILVGSLESLYGITVTFGSYLAVQFPVVGLVKGLALVLLVTLLFAEAPEKAGGPPETDRNLGEAGKRLLVVLIVTLLLWGLDAYHGISPAWIGLGAAILCMMPFMKILALEEAPYKTVFPVLIYVAAVLGVSAVMTESGAGQALSRALVDLLPLGSAGDLGRLALLTVMAMVTSLATTVPVAPAMTAPFFDEIAATTGWSIEAVAMSQVIGYATPLLPYQVPPLMLALAMSGVTIRETSRLLLWLALTTTPVTVLAAYLWWPVAL